jgi:tol-pal system protein YbgF
MKRLAILASLLALCLTAAAPAAAQNRVDQQLFLDIRSLDEQMKQLLLAVNQLSDALKAVNAKVDAESTARSKGFADVQTLVNNTNSNLSALQERTSDNKVQIQKVTQELEATKKGIDMLTVMVTQALSQIPANPTPPGQPGEPVAGQGSAPGIPPSIPPSSKEYYDRAFGDYAVGQYDLAIKGFQEYLTRFPDAPDAPAAQFSIGESYFMLGKFAEAVAAYDQVIKKYKATGADAVPDAYYKQGVAYEQLKRRDDAIANYELVRREYPNSPAALQATQVLRQLGRPLK